MEFAVEEAALHGVALRAVWVWRRPVVSFGDEAAGLEERRRIDEKSGRHPFDLRQVHRRPRRTRIPASSGGEWRIRRPLHHYPVAYPARTHRPHSGNPGHAVRHLRSPRPATGPGSGRHRQDRKPRHRHWHRCPTHLH
ncbi:hypothetical protein OG750_43585 [Streptomyces sp. NBC_01538]